MFYAARGVPDLGLVVATVIGGTFSAGSASVFNCVYDRDIDEQMRRTRRRALPRHIVTPRSALVFGFVLGILSTVILYVWVNPLSALLSVTAIAFYVFGYTMLLKRRTTQNIVWGGIAGCFPTLIGWTAVTGSLSWTPVVLFMVVFFWTPPHTWALALRYREDYANVDVPMLPVVKPAAEVGRQIVIYSWVMVATSLLLWPVADTSLFYPLAAAVARRRLPGAGPPDVGPRPRDREPLGDPADAALPHLEPLPLAALRRRCDRPADLALGAPSGSRSPPGARPVEEWTAALPTTGVRDGRRHQHAAAPSRTSSSAWVTVAEMIAAPSMWRPTSTTGRSVKYCTKPISPWASSTTSSTTTARRTAAARLVATPRAAARW